MRDDGDAIGHRRQNAAAVADRHRDRERARRGRSASSASRSSTKPSSTISLSAGERRLAPNPAARRSRRGGGGSRPRPNGGATAGKTSSSRKCSPDREPSPTSEPKKTKLGVRREPPRRDMLGFRPGIGLIGGRDAERGERGDRGVRRHDDVVGVAQHLAIDPPPRPAAEEVPGEVQRVPPALRRRIEGVPPFRLEIEIAEPDEPLDAGAGAHRPGRNEIEADDGVRGERAHRAMAGAVAASSRRWRKRPSSTSWPVRQPKTSISSRLPNSHSSSSDQRSLSRKAMLRISWPSRRSRSI